MNNNNLKQFSLVVESGLQNNILHNINENKYIKLKKIIFL